MRSDGTMVTGILRGIEDGWFTAEIAESAFAYQQALEKGDKSVVGVNVHIDTVETPLEILRVSAEVEQEQNRCWLPVGPRAIRPRWTVRSPGAQVAVEPTTWCRRCSTPLGPRPPWARSAASSQGVGQLHRAAALLAASTHPRSDQLRRRGRMKGMSQPQFNAYGAVSTCRRPLAGTAPCSPWRGGGRRFERTEAARGPSSR